MTLFFNMIAEQNFKALCDLTTDLDGDAYRVLLSLKSQERGQYQVPRSVQLACMWL
jgi:hypothetical protein